PALVSTLKAEFIDPPDNEDVRFMTTSFPVLMVKMLSISCFRLSGIMVFQILNIQILPPPNPSPCHSSLFSLLSSLFSSAGEDVLILFFIPGSHPGLRIFDP
ncbi:MAG: hypothetical protein V2I47_13145, partial [Bacteroidales bacterium]|nr:hypothetical protein [Bacteroidales bacterium]